MKKLLIIVGVIIVGLYLLGNWASDPETIQAQEEKLQAATDKLNQHLIKAAEEMSHEQVMATVSESKKMISKMVKATSGNPEMKQMFQDRLDALNNVQSKEDYISYLKNY